MIWFCGPILYLLKLDRLKVQAGFIQNIEEDPNILNIYICKKKKHYNYVRIKKTTLGRLYLLHF